MQATGGFYLCLQRVVGNDDVVLSPSQRNKELKILALSSRLCTPDTRQAHTHASMSTPTTWEERDSMSSVNPSLPSLSLVVVALSSSYQPRRGQARR